MGIHSSGTGVGGGEVGNPPEGFRHSEERERERQAGAERALIILKLK